MLYTATILLGDLTISLLVAMLTTAAGVLFSMRAATAQEAQQTLMAVLLIPLLILHFGSLFILRSESGRSRMSEVLRTVSLEQVLLAIIAVLLVLDAALLATSVMRFRRARILGPLVRMAGSPVSGIDEAGAVTPVWTKR
ncbi:MAG: hypothetical protein KGY78_06690 [Anaerolineae bacterium]|nr:hypothetical protein [Anaerolineae bacterium]